jgi:hypothetical protein
MRDWRNLVQERLGAMGAAGAQQSEIVAELASYLEDLYEDDRAQGVCESEAIELALGELADGRRLGRRIRKAKEDVMNERTKKFWLPALASLAAACALVAVTAQLSYKPNIVLLRSHAPTLVYPLWLLGQPLMGALGAYCSRRAGGNRLTRLTAGLFPSIVMFAVISIVAFAQGMSLGRGEFGRVDFTMLARALMGVIVIPSAAMLIGAAPFLRDPKTQVLARN